MRLMLVISSLARGGAERVISALATAWAQQGFEVTLVIFDDKEPRAYPIDERVTLHALKVSNATSRNFLEASNRTLRRVILLRRIIRKSKPEIIVSFLSVPNIVTILATRGLGIPVIVSERANPRFDKARRFWGPLRRLVYPAADAIVCQTNAMVNLLQDMVKVPARAIPNPVEMPQSAGSAAKKASEPGPRTIIAMGRLVPQKGFDMLLSAFSHIASRHPQWCIKVLGAGPDKEILESQAKSLGLEDRVTFVGAVDDPFSVMQAADLFVFSSRFEGFGNALAEAMACGLPVISFDCPAGPSDIIRNGIDGVLVPPEDVPGLAAAMNRLMGDPAERERLALRAPDVVSRFSMQRILGLWQVLFSDVQRARAQTHTPAQRAN